MVAVVLLLVVAYLLGHRRGSTTVHLCSCRTHRQPDRPSHVRLVVDET